MRAHTHLEIPVGPLLSQLHRPSCSRLALIGWQGPPFRLGLWPCPPPQPSPSQALEGTLSPGTETGPWLSREKRKARSPNKRKRGGGRGGPGSAQSTVHSTERESVRPDRCWQQGTRPVNNPRYLLPGNGRGCPRLPSCFLSPSLQEALPIGYASHWLDVWNPERKKTGSPPSRSSKSEVGG